MSIFGGIIALNRPVDLATATKMHALFLEIIMRLVLMTTPTPFWQRKKISASSRFRWARNHKVSWKASRWSVAYCDKRVTNRLKQAPI